VDGLFPMDRVDIEVNVKSLFTENTNPRIEDIELDIEIQNIADRGTDDINLEAVEFYLDPKESKDLSNFEFIVPKDVENNKLYTILITARGEDQEGVRHTVEFRGQIRTERAADDIRLTKFEMYPENITCEDEIIFSIEVTNLGVGTEDEAAYTIKCTDLDLFFSERFELEADPGRRTSEFNKEHTFEISPNVAPGRYKIIVKTFSDSTSEQDVENYYFDIYECEDRQPAVTPVEDDIDEEEEIEEDEEETVDVDETSDTDTSTDAPASTAEAGEVESYDVKSPLENQKLAILLIVGIAIVALILLYIAYMLIF
ncbi:hypothetical protein KY335_01030, partial [Candidatus Woesearchaeota archaeon]|nr:hypothetical protein [Candidatus Woesearchaeota archaeon]